MENITSFIELITQILISTNLKLLATISFIVYLYFTKSSNHVYLLDFVCYKPQKPNRVPISTVIEHANIMQNSPEFQTKVISKSGIGNESYLPFGTDVIPYDRTLKTTMEEFQTVLFSVVENLFAKNNINPRTIDIVITNCSLVSPTPSLSSLIINKFGFRSNVRSFNLSGMGCSAGILSISLAKDLLRVHKNSLVLVLSMESVVSNVYQGTVKSMLLPNSLFRMGGVAILLTNNNRCKSVAKYELLHLVRTNLSSKDSAYKCVFQEQDDDGHVGVSLSRSITQVAGEALKINISTLAVFVLPYSELIRYTISLIWKRLGTWSPSKKLQGFSIPDFRKAFEHFCVHAGGRAVIDAFKENLKLKDGDIEASKMTLYKFGNTSSSSVWYSLSYLEAQGRVKRADRIWQLAFGSGFKCNSAVWKCVNKVKSKDYSNVWSEVIDRFPMEVPDVMDH